ncbi:MAG: acyl-[acyl-carrier-protein]--UDP-N-acetylglucosamine O-acyltransferase [Candidatus Sericytochromatia bacterium]|nr:MAG: acyl-[acyl-carrier-protein]--UDP-N-acetylglucosamine O-acyltransferase [Candidatus Sericytochromatia bacterium]
MQDIYYLNYKKISIGHNSTIDKTSVIGNNVIIGNNVVIGKNVIIGNNTSIMHNCIIEDDTIIGDNCQIYYGAVIGSTPQDLKYKNQKTRVIIGNNNIIREYVTINRACSENNETKIGNNNLLMAYTHIAHDCVIGNNNIFANSVNFGGHCIVHDNCVIGGITGIHQFVKIGSYSMIGGMSRVTQDVPPFVVLINNSNNVEGLNLVGLKRNGFSKEKIKFIQEAYNLLYKSNLNFTEKLEKIKKLALISKDIEYFFNFISQESKRGISGLYNKSC